MINKSIKISDENYKWLVRLSGELQKKLGKPISIDLAINTLRTKRKLSDHAGTWDVEDNEWVEIEKSLSDNWRKWKKSA